jgi:tetratricopeptide (TPR) repeat protein
MPPVCFMIMPYGERETGVAADVGLTKVDFNALWTNVYQPAIEKLGYVAVRADQELGSVIIKDMIERLAISSLVIADITIANANVYYEVGVRHAAAPRGCVLISAKWARPAFDLAQIRHLQFELKSKAPSGAEADALRDELVAAIQPHVHASSPIFDLLPGFPPAQLDDATSFQDLVSEISSFEGRARAAANIADANERKAKLKEIADSVVAEPVIDSIALDLVPVIRDKTDFETLLAFIDALPERLRTSPFAQEQRALAQSKLGNHLEAIAGLEALIQLRGETSERRGLLGGRYKKLYLQTNDREYLNKAIDNYTKGMYLDLNDYYSPSNLPRLLRTRGGRKDEKAAVTAAEITRAGCARKAKLDPDDEWLGQTMLGQAVDAMDVEQAAELVDDLVNKGQTKWKLDVTAADIQMSLKLIKDPALRAQFDEVLAPLQR